MAVCVADWAPHGRRCALRGHDRRHRDGRSAISPNRIAAHLGYNIHSNALRRYVLHKQHAHLEDCSSLEFFAFGPVYPRPVHTVDYPTVRSKVAALEKHLWKRMEASGYDMLNPQPRATAEPDEDRLDEICASFRRHFAKLR